MLISKRKCKEYFEVNVTEEGIMKKLKLKKSIKVLGVYLDDELNWTRHVNEVNKKARNATRNLQRINRILPLKSNILLYNSLVASHFNYADTVWSGCNQNSKNKLQRTQNCAIKSILGMKRREPSEKALKAANLLTLEEKRKVHEAVYTHKALSGKLPKAITEEYQQYTSTMNNRSAERKILSIPKHKTENYKNSPLYRTIKTWNNTPDILKKNTDTTIFKQNYQKYLHTLNKN